MSWKGPIDKIGDCRYRISEQFKSNVLKQHGLRMNVPGLVYCDEKMIETIRADDALYQVTNVATLPGIVSHSIAMPDIHHGYGFAIGAVAAFDADEGIISPGGVGYDINCGVRLLRSDLTADDIRSRVPKLVDTMFANVPSGVGSTSRLRLSNQEMDDVLANGARWIVANGYGSKDDLDVMEEGGGIEGADPSLISDSARKRGSNQLGTLGAGNHFLEIQRVDEIYDPETAAAFGITATGQVTIMIHTGSRGCGHQICTDYLEAMRAARKKYGIRLPDPQLVCAPASSPEAQRYFSAMKAAANYAWANRQMITHQVRQSFEAVLKQSAERLGLDLIYDLAHNMAKLEEHEVEGRLRHLYVHRKGATRAFGPGHPEIPQRYRHVGQPVLIPGDMGTASYLLVGTELGMRETFGSSCHGAGRRMSRHASVRRHRANEVFAHLKDKGIYLQAKSKRVVAEEAPGAYKDIDNVVEITHRAGIARKVARMTPMGVVKG
ncbi:MAG: RtcB family protein [candidate division Zixibacteria bacterium]|nr:RtcB family protein [candidate division Zixibacteria bacterium]